VKAGLMEIADIFALNKSDRQGADGIAATLKNIIHLKPPSENKWEINVLKITGIKNEGIEELLNGIMKHKNHLESTSFLAEKRKNNLTKKILELVNSKLEVSFWDENKRKFLKDSLSKIYGREDDPYSFVEKIVESS
jgi:LAO/AO transport system kinase